MDTRPAVLIALLGLRPHPEGGHYREIFRSAYGVTRGDGRGRRAALTSIYFLLSGGEVSRWHRVASDEAWHFYAGTGLELLRMPSGEDAPAGIESSRLGPVGVSSDGRMVRPTATIPAGDWQAARPVSAEGVVGGGYALVGCTVGPGFDFADFALMADEPAVAERVRASLAAFADLI